MEAPILSEPDSELTVQEMECETALNPATATATVSVPVTETETNALTLTDNESVVKTSNDESVDTSVETSVEMSVETNVETNGVPIKEAPVDANADADADADVEVEAEPDAEDSSMEENPDRTTESPTTGDNNNTLNGIKCVFCNQVLNAGDVPKLLECLHSACGACVKSKIVEHNQTDVENSTESKGMKQFNIAIICFRCL